MRVRRADGATRVHDAASALSLARPRPAPDDGEASSVAYAERAMSTIMHSAAIFQLRDMNSSGSLETNWPRGTACVDSCDQAMLALLGSFTR